MGALKDVVDLSTQLANSIQDRKFATDLFKIIELIGVIQAEQANLTENNIQLMSNNEALKKQVTSLESEIVELNQQITEIQTPSTSTGHNLSELALKILHFCSEIDEGVSVSMVQHKLNISGAKSELELGKLQEAELIDYGSLAMGQEIQFVPTQVGLAILDENDLI